ncbi:hypothetical protein ACIHJG_32920 [Streptomyces sp. NPDC052415]|uniref:hypothetical protein n=1 Tax=Streptomyces sp. NPDC052415 TaxID=3365690 RepID=UPI0037D1762B
MTRGTEEQVGPHGESAHGEAGAPADSAGPPKSGRLRFLTDRPVPVAAAAAFALCAGLVAYGVLRGEESDPPRKVPTAAVTYEVTGQGRVDITYQGASENGTAETVTRARLPWRMETKVPLGRTPVVSVVIGSEGGNAKCALAIKGRHVQSATANGAYGRTGCRGVLPSPSPSGD